MPRTLRPALTAAKRYPWLIVSIVAGLVSAGMLAAGLGWIAYWLVAAVATAVGVRAVIAIVRSFRAGAWGVDALALIAIIATLLTGELVAAMVILVMLTGGEALQDYAERRARDSLTGLLDHAPDVGHLLVPGSNRDVPVAELMVGDVVEVRPGEIVPVDGVLLDAGLFDESSITGEPIAVDRAAGTGVLSGAVNGDAAVRVRAMATAAHSQLATIIDLVAAAADSRAPFVRLADRVAIPFTVFALGIAAIAWAVSGDASRFAAVLVVATPCPLLIAAPVAFIAGTNRAAHDGIIVKSGGVLEVLARIRTVALDKTGTITEGTPGVVRVEPGTNGLDPLHWAAAVEAHSTHVLAAAIVAHAHVLSRTPALVEHVRETPGMGATGIVEGSSVVVGKRDFLATIVPSLPEARLNDGETAVYVAVDGRYAGRIVLEDRIRANAAATLGRLDDLGLTHRLMLTGDGHETANSVARLVGITEVMAGLLPAGKVQAIRAADHPVLMVGDGVNDAPVLAAADVGIAMGARGSTAASESADVVIMVDDLSKVPDVIVIARRTVRIARQSVWIGIGVSVALMIVAALGLLPAVIGAILQEGLDVLVILNGLRARKPSRGTFDPDPASQRSLASQYGSL